MKRKTTFLKSLLLAAGLLVGANAWGQISKWTATSGTYTSGQNITGNVSGVITMTLGNDAGWTYDSSREGVVTRTKQTPTLTDGIPTAGGYIVITPTRNLNLKMLTYSSQSNCNVYMYEGTTKLKDFRQKGYNTNDYGTLEAGKTYYIYGGSFRTAGDATNLEYVFFNNFTATTIENYTIKYVDDKGNKIAEDKEYTGLYGTTVTASAEDMASIVYNEKDYGYLTGNKNLTLSSNAEDNVITLVYETATICNYTIKYVDGEGNSIAEDKEVESYVGATVTASGENIPTYLWNSDIKYKYTTGNIELTVSGTAEDDVITLVYNEAPSYSYALKTSLGATLLSGTGYEAEEVNYGFPKYQLSGTNLYTTTKNSGNPWWGGKFTLTSNQEVTKTYTDAEITNVVYLKEGEEITGATVVSSGNSAIRSSQCKAGYATDNTVLVNLPAGKYVLTADIYSPSSGGATFTFNAGETQIAQFKTGNGNTTIVSSEEFTLETSKDIILVAGGGQSAAIDYLYIRRTGDYTESKTIGDAGYATYCSANALDFSGATGLTAYIATVAGSTVSFSPVTSVPANTGVLLKGDAGTYEFTAVASSSTNVDNNKLVGVTEATAKDAGIYVLMDGAKGVGFYKTTNAFTVGANSAYLPADVVANAKSFIGFGDVTGIESLKAEKVANGQWFNLAGQRVAQPTKGLYIQNGKKVIVK